MHRFIPVPSIAGSQQSRLLHWSRLLRSAAHRDLTALRVVSAQEGLYGVQLVVVRSVVFHLRSVSLQERFTSVDRSVTIYLKFGGSAIPPRWMSSVLEVFLHQSFTYLWVELIFYITD